MKKKAKLPLETVKAWVPWTLFGLALAEVGLSIFQWVELRTVESGGTTVCALNAAINCETVWTSVFAQRVTAITGIPVAGLGLVWGLAASVCVAALLWRARSFPPASAGGPAGPHGRRGRRGGDPGLHRRLDQRRRAVPHLPRNLPPGRRLRGVVAWKGCPARSLQARASGSGHRLAGNRCRGDVDRPAGQGSRFRAALCGHPVGGAGLADPGEYHPVPGQPSEQRETGALGSPRPVRPHPGARRAAASAPCAAGASRRSGAPGGVDRPALSALPAAQRDPGPASSVDSAGPPLHRGAPVPARWTLQSRRAPEGGRAPLRWRPGADLPGEGARLLDAARQALCRPAHAHSRIDDGHRLLRAHPALPARGLHGQRRGEGQAGGRHPLRRPVPPDRHPPGGHQWQGGPAGADVPLRAGDGQRGPHRAAAHLGVAPARHSAAQ